MSENQQTRRRVAVTQLLHLWEFLSEHREIAVGYNKSTQARDHSRRIWERVAAILNSSGEGAIKSGSEWSKYWVDLKAKIKRKNRFINDSRSRTGGGSATNVQLSDIEQRFLTILGEDYGSGLTGVQVNPLVSQSSISNSGPSQSTASEEPLYLIVNVESGESVSQLHHDPEMAPVTHSSQSAHSTAPVGDTERNSPVRSVSPPPPPPSSSSPPPPPQPPSSSPPPPPQPPSHSRQVSSEQGPRRRQRRREPHLTATEARRRLVIASENRAQAELNNSRCLETALGILREMVSTLQRIAARLSNEAATGDLQDPAL